MQLFHVNIVKVSTALPLEAHMCIFLNQTTCCSYMDENGLSQSFSLMVLLSAQAHTARNRQIFYTSAMLDIVTLDGGCIEWPQA